VGSIGWWDNLNPGWQVPNYSTIPNVRWHSIAYNYIERLVFHSIKGPSEMRGYLLWERHGVRLRIAQWEWIRMKIGTPTYLDRLRALMEDLKEIIAILGPIRYLILGPIKYLILGPIRYLKWNIVRKWSQI
jgi:hypothetical protein